MNRALHFALEELALHVAEIPGPGVSPRIALYQKMVGREAPDDEVSWCSAFAAFCVASAAYPLEHVTEAARSWLTWGEEAPAALGNVCVLWRGDPNGWQGHVGFLLDASAESLVLLGGNQGDRVSVAVFPKGRILGYRTPRGGW